MQHLIVYEQHPAFLDYLHDQLGVRFDPATTRTLSHLAQAEDGTLSILAVVAYSNWTNNSVELSIASSPCMWASKRFIRAVYEYAFQHCGKLCIHMLVEDDNLAAKALHERLGHKYGCRIEDWFGDGRDGHLFTWSKKAFLASKWAR
jgi:RimJ/RimL family protein N-acetyltransferase